MGDLLVAFGFSVGLLLPKKPLRAHTLPRYEVWYSETGEAYPVDYTSLLATMRSGGKGSKTSIRVF